MIKILSVEDRLYQAINLIEPVRIPIFFHRFSSRNVGSPENVPQKENFDSRTIAVVGTRGLVNFL